MTNIHRTTTGTRYAESNEDIDDMNILPWINLAAAIVKSGSTDKRFQESEWCEYLKESVSDYINRKQGNQQDRLPTNVQSHNNWRRE